MTPQKKSFGQAEKHILTIGIYDGHAFVIKYIYQEAHKNLKCMRRFPRAFHTSNPLAKTCENMLKRNNKNQMPEGAGRSPTDRLRESLV